MTVLETFQDDLVRNIDESLNLIRTVNHIISTPGLPINLSIEQRDFIVEWVFVKIHTSWEYFIENCFLAYMLGEQTTSGFAPVRYIFPNDERHALDIILAGRDYFRWTDPSIVKKHSALCFENGEPFRTALDSRMTQLQDMNTIRNAVVHQSRTALDRFKSLVRKELLTAPLDITPGKFLLKIKPKTLKTTYFNSYCNTLRFASNKIVPS